MRVRIGITVLALIASCYAGRAVADPTGTHIYLVPFGGYTVFDGNLRYGGNPLQDKPYYGGRFGWQARPWVALEAASGYTPTKQDVPNGQDVSYLHGSGNFVFTPWGGLWGGPFLSAGFGMARLRSAGGESLNQGNLEAAAGLHMWFTDRIGGRLEARDLLWLSKDQITDVQAHDWIFGAGLLVALGGHPRDTDGDGVPDRKDKCPDTPHGATVDATGCPHDTDGDGVLDGIDQCPGTPKGATVDAKGCPADADGDGVFDGIDLCPNTPKGATVDAKGCPADADSDGVFDGLDACPNTLRGCTVDEKGCPKDADGDGVCDGLDKCPDTPPGLKVDANGCPTEMMEKQSELVETGRIRLEDINFETGKSTIMPETQPRLDAVGAVLVQWPQLKIEIGGHTDNVGKAKDNLKLSQARAQSVEDYLVQKFKLDPQMFTVKGYGSTMPIAPNTSDLERARNRRVEFVVKNLDVLKTEVEKRGKPATPAPADTTRKK